MSSEEVSFTIFCKKLTNTAKLLMNFEGLYLYFYFFLSFTNFWRFRSTIWCKLIRCSYANIKSSTFQWCPKILPSLPSKRSKIPCPMTNLKNLRTIAISNPNSFLFIHYFVAGALRSNSLEWTGRQFSRSLISQILKIRHSATKPLQCNQLLIAVGTAKLADSRRILSCILKLIVLKVA